MAQHKDLADSELHEPKGVSTASEGKVAVARSGVSQWELPSGHNGFWDYNDLNTTSTPIPLTLADTQYELTNDGLGVNTNSTYKPYGYGEIWKTATNRFDFSDLDLGDTVDIRLDIDVVTTSANADISITIELGTGGTPYEISLINQENKKVAGTYKISSWLGFYIGDSNTLNNTGRILAKSDSTGVTVIVNDLYVRVIKR